MKHFIPIFISFLFLTNTIIPQQWQKFNGPWTGSFSTLTTSSSNPAVMFSGGSSGIFGSTDYGFTWRKVSANDGRLISQGSSISDWVASPFEKSTDGGINWKGLSIPVITSHQKIKDFEINPNSAGSYFLLDDKYLFSSPDLGETWTIVDDSVNKFLYYSQIIKISKVPANIIYTIGPYGYIRKSTDGGATWVRKQYTNDNSDYSDKLNAEINHQNGNILYITRGNKLYKSVNGGTNWTTQTVSESEVTSITVSKSNPDIIYISHYHGISRSVNGGSNWELIYNNHPREVVTSLMSPVTDYLLKTTRDQGIFLSTNSGASFISVGGEPLIPAGMRFQNADINIIAWDSHGIYKSTNGGVNWKFCLAHGSASDNGLSISTGNPVNWSVCSGDDYKLYLTFDAGETWAEVQAPVLNNPVEIYHNPANSVHVYLNSGTSLARSLDYLNYWSLLPDPFPGESIELLTFNPQNQNQIFASANTCLCIIKSDDAGQSWLSFKNGIEEDLTGSQIHDIKFDPQNLNSIFASSGELYKLTLPSSTWSKIYEPTSQFPYAPRKLLIDPGNSNRMYSLYAPCTLIGSTNKGVSWGKANLGLPDKYKTVSAAFIGSTGKIYLASGDGIVHGSPILTDISDEKPLAGSPAAYSLGQNFPNPANPITTIKYSLANYSSVVLKLFNILGKEMGTFVNEYQSPGEYSVQLNTAEYPSGVYVYKLQAGGFSESKKMILLK